MKPSMLTNVSLKKTSSYKYFNNLILEKCGVKHVI